MTESYVEKLTQIFGDRVPRRFVSCSHMMMTSTPSNNGPLTRLVLPSGPHPLIKDPQARPIWSC